MAAQASAGLLCYRHDAESACEVLLAHPGGPFFARKDAGAWTIPKGLVEPGESLLQTAVREFREEMGWSPEPGTEMLPLGSVRLKSGKTVHAWGFRTDLATLPLLPATSVFSIEWPPKSGRQMSFPEIDRAAFFAASAALEKMAPAQHPFLERLASLVGPG